MGCAILGGALIFTVDAVAYVAGGAAVAAGAATATATAVGKAVIGDNKDDD